MFLPVRVSFTASFFLAIGTARRKIDLFRLTFCRLWVSLCPKGSLFRQFLLAALSSITHRATIHSSRLVCKALITLFLASSTLIQWEDFSSFSLRRSVTHDAHPRIDILAQAIFHNFPVSPRKSRLFGEHRVPMSVFKSLEAEASKDFPSFSAHKPPQTEWMCVRREFFRFSGSERESDSKLRWSSCMDAFFTFVTSMENPRNPQ